MISKLYWRFTLTDAGGQKLSRTGLIPARSFVVAYLQHVRCMMARANQAGVVDEGNASRTLRSPLSGATNYMLLTGSATRGIMAGSGINAVDIEDHDFQTRIINGGGAGQLAYAPLVVSAPAFGANFAQIALIRALLNTSVGNTTVREVGLKCVTVDTGAVGRVFLLARDLVSPIQVVPPGGTLTIEGIFRATV